MLVRSVVASLAIAGMIVVGDVEGYSGYAYVALALCASTFLAQRDVVVYDYRAQVRAATCLGAVAAWSCVSYVIGSGSAPLTSGKLLSCGLVYAIVVQAAARSRAACDMAIWGFLVAVGIHAIAGSYQYWSGDLRVRGLTTNANFLGILGLLACMVAVARHQCGAMLHAAMAVHLYWMSVITGSRKTLVVGGVLLVASAVVSSVHARRRSRLWAGVLLCAAALWAVGVVAGEPQKASATERLASLSSERGDGGSFADRTTLAQAGLRVIRENFVMGVGLDNTARTNELGLYYHNNYIELGAGVGLLGLLVYYFWKISLLGSLARRCHGSEAWRFSVVLGALLLLDVGAVTYDNRPLYVALGLMHGAGLTRRHEALMKRAVRSDTVSMPRSQQALP